MADEGSVTSSESFNPAAVKSPVRRSTRGSPSPSRPRTEIDGELRGVGKQNSNAGKSAFGRKIPDSSPVKRHSSKQNMDKEIELNDRGTSLDLVVREETKNSDILLENTPNQSEDNLKKDDEETADEETDRTFEIHQKPCLELLAFLWNRTLTDIQFYFVDSYNKFIAKDIEHAADRRSQRCANFIFVIWIIALIGLGLWMIRYFPNASGYPIDRTEQKANEN